MKKWTSFVGRITLVAFSFAALLGASISTSAPEQTGAAENAAVDSLQSKNIALVPMSQTDLPINPLSEYHGDDIRSDTMVNSNPLYVLSGSKYIYNLGFNWEYIAGDENSIHETAWRKPL